MRFFTSVKLFVLLIILILFAIFINQNTHHVPIQFPFARPYEFRLIIMLSLALLAGLLLGIFSVLVIQAKIAKMGEEEENEDLVEED